MINPHAVEATSLVLVAFVSLLGLARRARWSFAGSLIRRFAARRTPGSYRLEWPRWPSVRLCCRFTRCRCRG